MAGKILDMLDVALPLPSSNTFALEYLIATLQILKYSVSALDLSRGRCSSFRSQRRLVRGRDNSQCFDSFSHMFIKHFENIQL